MAFYQAKIVLYLMPTLDLVVMTGIGKRPTLAPTFSSIVLISKYLTLSGSCIGVILIA